MTELDNLIEKDKLKEVAPSSYEALFSLPASAGLFKGHFPQKAIVPGVVLIEALRQAAALALGKKVTIKGIKQVKFKSLVLPDEIVIIAFNIKDDDGLYAIKATLKSGDELKAKMQITLAGDENSTN